MKNKITKNKFRCIKNSNTNKNINLFKNKQSQLKIGESILVLLIFFILLTMGLIFYAKIQGHVMQQEAEDFTAKRTIDMALAVKFFPELQCTTLATEEFDCIDMGKLLMFNDLSTINPSYSRYYAQLFPNAKITIKQAFAPFGGILPMEGVVLVDNIYLQESEITNFKKLALPITIYDPVMDANSFGFIELEAVS